MVSENRPAGDDVRIAENVNRTLSLRRDGYSFRTIAKTLGCSVSTAYEYYRRGMDELQEVTEEEAEALRAMENERLDTAQRVIMGAINKALDDSSRLVQAQQDEKAVKRLIEALPAVDRLVTLSARRAALNGLDRAKKVGLEITDDELVNKARRELAKVGVSLDEVLGGPPGPQ